MGDAGKLVLVLADALAKQGDLFKQLHEQLEGQRDAIRKVDIPALEARTLRIEELNALIQQQDELRRNSLAQLEELMGHEAGTLTLREVAVLQEPALRQRLQHSGEALRLHLHRVANLRPQVQLMIERSLAFSRRSMDWLRRLHQRGGTYGPDARLHQPSTGSVAIDRTA